MQGGDKAVRQPKNNKSLKGRPRVQIDDQVLEQLYVVEGLSVRVIGERLGVSHQTVARRLAEANIPIKRWRLPGEH